jgi:hypothetical protein
MGFDTTKTVVAFVALLAIITGGDDDGSGEYQYGNDGKRRSHRVWGPYAPPRDQTRRVSSNPAIGPRGTN